MKTCSVLLGMGMLAPAGSAVAENAKLNDFLVDMSAGHVAAFQMINLDKSAVTDLQTPKDLVAALGAASDSNAKGGFGIAYSPGRSAFAPMAVPLIDYRNPSKPLARLWGSTSFSYAQNTKSLGGVDYAQNALAVHVAYYLRPGDDPVVAGFDALAMRGGKCDTLLLETRNILKADNRSVIQRVNDRRIELGRDLTEVEYTQLEADVLDASQTASASPQKLQQCAQDYVDLVKQKWNASHVDLVLGQGWIKAPGGTRLSLGRHAALAASVGFDELPNSLFNLTVRRVDRELDLASLAATPLYKRSTTVGARYTYGYGEGRKSYLIAELSTARIGTLTTSNEAFRQALGYDYKLSEGVWLQLRVGKAVSDDGSKMESKALFSLKFSPQTTLAKDIGAK